MNNIISLEEVSTYAQRFDNYDTVTKTSDVKLLIQQVLEQIEEAKLSELGEVIEKLKQDYK